MKRSALVIAMAVIITTILSLPILAAEPLRIGVAIPTADHGWTGGIVWWARQAIDDWNAKDPDLDFFLVTADSASQQVDQIEDLMVKGIDALVVLAHDSAPLTPVVEKAYREGIFIVSVDRGLTKPVENVYVAGDNPGLGRQSG